MMRNEILRPLEDPSKVTHAQLDIAQRRSQSESRRVAKGLRAPSGALHIKPTKSALAQRLGSREIETQKIAPVICHRVTLT